MSDLLAEVDEAMRYERVEQFWKENGRFIIFLIAAVILATAAMSGYRHWNKTVRAEQTAKVFEILESSDFPNNVLESDLSVRPSLKAIILLQAGEAFVAQNNTDNAIKLYDRAAADTAIDKDFRQLATLMSGRLKMQQDSANPEELMAALQDIVNDQDSPWQNHALLDAALIAGDMQSDYSSAMAYINEVIDTANIPETLRTRASSLAHVYGLKQNENKKDQDS